MNIKKNAILLAWAAVAASAQAAITNGNVIGLDFGPNNPTNNFNQINVWGESADLFLLSDGSTTTGVTINLYAQPVSRFINADSSLSDSLVSLSADYDVSNVTDWAGAYNSSELSITFNNLDDSLAYDLEGVIGGFNANNHTDGTSMIVNGQDSDPFGDSSANPRIANLYGISSTAGSFTLVLDGAQVNVLSALTLTAIPEPGTYAFIVGILGLSYEMVRRRR